MGASGLAASVLEFWRSGSSEVSQLVGSWVGSVGPCRYRDKRNTLSARYNATMVLIVACNCECNRNLRLTAQITITGCDLDSFWPGNCDKYAAETVSQWLKQSWWHWTRPSQ